LLSFGGLRRGGLPRGSVRFGGTGDFGDRAAGMCFGLRSDAVGGLGKRVANGLLTFGGLRRSGLPRDGVCFGC
ncbi:hypothetical protein, partial [Burkholderia sp. 3C]